MAFLSKCDGSAASTGLTLVLIFLLSSCGTSGTAPGERLDPETAATYGRADSPLHFYRDESGRAAYARAYLDLGPLWVNTMGDYRYYLWITAWSSVADRVDTTGMRDALTAVTIIADGEPVGLEVTSWTTTGIGLTAQPYRKPFASAAEAYYTVTLDQVRLLAEADDIRILTAGDADSYEPWSKPQRGRKSLQGFLALTPR